MPQEFYVLKCFSCETFQVHIVKKAKKWECKMCGSKQSLKRNYGKGSSKDCRNQVMKLNELRLSKCDSLKQIELDIFEENYTDNHSEEPLTKKSKEPLVSKWAEYIEENVPDSESETDETQRNFKLNFNDKKKKRVRKMPESYFKNKKVCRESNDSKRILNNYEEKVKLCSATKNKKIFNCEEKIESCSSTNIKKIFNCFDEPERTTNTDDFTHFKNEPKLGKYAKYLEDQEVNNDLVEKVNKTSTIFESNLSDLDDILHF